RTAAVLRRAHPRPPPSARLRAAPLPPPTSRRRARLRQADAIPERRGETPGHTNRAGTRRRRLGRRPRGRDRAQGRSPLGLTSSLWRAMMFRPPREGGGAGIAAALSPARSPARAPAGLGHGGRGV